MHCIGCRNHLKWLVAALIVVLEIIMVLLAIMVMVMVIPRERH